MPWEIYHNSRQNNIDGGGWIPISCLDQQETCSTVTQAVSLILGFRETLAYQFYFDRFNYKAVGQVSGRQILLFVNGEITAEAERELAYELAYMPTSNPTPEESMPVILSPSPAVAQLEIPVPDPAPASDGAPAPLVSVAIKRTKPSHRLVLEINAKPLHDLLDGIGVPHDRTGYTERPSSTYRVASGDNLSTELFLKREYPVSVDLSQILSAPVSHSRLEALANSTHAALSKILEFYQPVDIQINVLPKIAK